MRFGDKIRQTRLDLQDKDRRFSMRHVAYRVGIEPSYLSKIERGLERAPSAETIVKLAEVLGEDVDHLLALAGKVSPDLTSLIIHRPHLMAPLLRRLGALPDSVLLQLLKTLPPR